MGVEGGGKHTIGMQGFWKLNPLSKKEGPKEEEDKKKKKKKLEISDIYTYIVGLSSIGTHAIPQRGTKSSPRNIYPPPPTSVVRQ